MGAGATRGAIKHIVHNQKRIKAPLNGDFFKIAETYARAHGNNSAEMKRYKRLHHFFRYTLPFNGEPTMEEAFSSLYIAKDFPGIYHTGPGRRQAAGHRSEIEDFLRLTFGILTTLDQGTNNSIYDRLVTRLGQQDVIITLNYDTLLDSALVRKGWEPKTGYYLSGGKQKVDWRPQGNSSYPNLKHVKLLKLHGSLNWYVRGSFNHLSRVFGNKPVKIGRPRKSEIRNHIRQIVPPIYGKFFGHSHWQKLWKKGYQSLCDTEIFVIIGCSLVDTDFHLRSLLSRISQHRKKTNKFKKIILVDCVTVRRKWKKVLKGTYQKALEYNTFEKFVKELKI